MNSVNRRNPNLTNLWVDVLILAAALTAFAPNLTGLLIHEWLGLAFGITVWVHLLLHWQWLVGITRHFFTKARWSARFSYLLNAAIFIGFTVIIFSGVMESRFVLQTFGVNVTEGGIWKALHSLAAEATLWLTALHIAVHWRWIWSWIKKLARLPRRKPVITAQRELAVEPVKIDD